MALRVAISGAGYVVPFHIRAWRDARADIVAIFDPDEARVRARAEEFSIDRPHSSYEQMLADGGFDAVDIASPREFHVTQSIHALDAGFPVLCQKPVATSPGEAGKLRDRLTAGGRFMVHENWRFRPEYRRLANWIDEGLLGELRYGEISVRTCALLPDENGLRPALARQPFFASQSRLLVAEVLIHHLDTARRLFGELQLATARLRRTQIDLPGETQANLQFLTPIGASVSVTGDMTAPGAPPGATDRVEVCGSKGRAVFEAGMLRLFPVAGQAVEVDFSTTDSLQASFDNAIAHFVDCLRLGNPFETSLADNLKTLELIEAAYEMQNRSLQKMGAWEKSELK